MQLTHDQKSYIKKNIKRKNISEMARDISISEQDILSYLKRRWSAQKLDKYLQLQRSNPFRKDIMQTKSVAATVSHSTFFTWRTIFEYIVFNRFYFLSLIALIAIIYFNSLGNQFVSDDITEIANNPTIRDFSLVAQRPSGFIRPLLYSVTYTIFGLQPIFFRIPNLLFHVGSTIVLFLILTKLYNKKLAYISSLIFATHPLLTEPIAWISGGLYVQYSFFFLIALLLYIFHQDLTIKLQARKWFYIGSVAFYLFALLTHPVMPLSLPGVLIVYDLIKGNLRKSLIKYIPFAFLCMIWVAINVSILPVRIAALQYQHYQDRGVDNPFVQIPIAISSYLQLFVWPSGLTLYHSELSFSTIQYIIQLIVFIFLLIAVGFSYFKSKVIFFWLTFFLISLLTTLTPYRLNWIVAERYVYLGSIGLATILGYAFYKLSEIQKTRAIAYCLLVILISVFSILTIVRNNDWKNEDSLWIATGKTSPSSPNTHNNLGDVYGRRGDLQAAVKEFQTAITIKPNYADAYHNLANTYQQLGDSDLALENYKKAIQYNPSLWQSYQNIASIYFDQKQYDLSIENMQNAIKIFPTSSSLYANLGIIYMNKDDKQQAIQYLNMALQLDPANANAQKALSQLQ